MVVGSVIAAAEAIVTAEAHQRRSVAGRSLFDLPLGDPPIYSITEEPVETTAADRHGANPAPGQTWHGLPVFAAWITDPSDAHSEPVG
jgi:hypothetical protein